MGRILVLAAGLALALAGTAHANTIRYTVPPSPDYTVDNNVGIVKVTYVNCVTTGVPQTLNLTVNANAGKAGNASLKVLKTPSGGTATTSPDPVSLKQGDNAIPVTMSFTP